MRDSRAFFFSDHTYKVENLYNTTRQHHIPHLPPTEITLITPHLRIQAYKAIITYTVRKADTIYDLAREA